MSMQEAKARGWDELDVVFITGDAYIDHPSFAMAILGRVLDTAGKPLPGGRVSLSLAGKVTGLLEQM